MWVNFSISENELLRYRDQIAEEAADRFRRITTSKSRSCWPTARCFPRAATSTSPIRRSTPRRAPSSCERRSPTRRAACGRGNSCVRGSQARCARMRSLCRSARSCRARKAISSGWSTTIPRPMNAWWKPANGTATTGSSPTDCKPGERIVVDGAIRVIADTPLKIVGRAEARLPATPAAAECAGPGSRSISPRQTSDQTVTK